MLSLPLALLLEKNKLVATDPWLLLLEITLPDTSVIRLVANTEDITFSGHTWTAFAFKLGEQGQSDDGKVQNLTIQVANPARALTPYIEAQGGLVGSQVRLMVVHAANLAEDYTALTLNYTIIASQVDEQWATFTLGAENPLRKRFPLYSALPLNCAWVSHFKGAECGYAGGDSTCAGTLIACRAKNNSARFGGRPGATGAVRFV
jgi:phage-related protein